MILCLPMMCLWLSFMFLCVIFLAQFPPWTCNSHFCFSLILYTLYWISCFAVCSLMSECYWVLLTCVCAFFHLATLKSHTISLLKSYNSCMLGIYKMLVNVYEYGMHIITVCTCDIYIYIYIYIYIHSKTTVRRTLWNTDTSIFIGTLLKLPL